MLPDHPALLCKKKNREALGDQGVCFEDPICGISGAGVYGLGCRV